MGQCGCVRFMHFLVIRHDLWPSYPPNSRSARCVRGLSRFAESLACWRPRASPLTAAISKPSTRAIKTSHARRWSAAWRKIEESVARYLSQLDNLAYNLTRVMNIMGVQPPSGGDEGVVALI